MTSSLVGSEMCIRDSHQSEHAMVNGQLQLPWMWCSHETTAGSGERQQTAVSYTHLTLPTICSV
eukprot:3595897-Prorocentrum_lima.AAC.1